MPKPIPEGYRSVNVILTVDDAAKAIDFYKQAFGAKELSRLPMGDKIGHAELQIGDTRFMLNDEFPERGQSWAQGARRLVDRADRLSSMMWIARSRRRSTPAAPRRWPVEDQFWGDRMGTLTDPFGHSGASPPMSRMCRKRSCRRG